MKDILAVNRFAKASKGMFFWGKEGKEILKDNLKLIIEEEREIFFRNQRKSQRYIVVILFSMTVPTKYKELLEEGNYFEKELNKHFPEFKFKIVETEEIKDLVEKEFKDKERADGENIVRLLNNRLEDWKEKENSFDYSEKYKEGTDISEKKIIGIRK